MAPKNKSAPTKQGAVLYNHDTNKPEYVETDKIQAALESGRYSSMEWKPVERVGPSFATQMS